MPSDHPNVGGFPPTPLAVPSSLRIMRLFRRNFSGRLGNTADGYLRSTQRDHTVSSSHDRSSCSLRGISSFFRHPPSLLAAVIHDSARSFSTRALYRSITTIRPCSLFPLFSVRHRGRDIIYPSAPLWAYGLRSLIPHSPTSNAPFSTY